MLKQNTIKTIENQSQTIKTTKINKIKTTKAIDDEDTTKANANNNSNSNITTSTIDNPYDEETKKLLFIKSLDSASAKSDEPLTFLSNNNLFTLNLFSNTFSNNYNNTNIFEFSDENIKFINEEIITSENEENEDKKTQAEYDEVNRNSNNSNVDAELNEMINDLVELTDEIYQNNSKTTINTSLTATACMDSEQYENESDLLNLDLLDDMLEYYSVDSSSCYLDDAKLNLVDTSSMIQKNYLNFINSTTNATTTATNNLFKIDEFLTA